MISFKGQVAIVTGGARGLGFGIAKKLGELGAKVTIADLDASNGQQAVLKLAALGIEAISVQCDVTEEQNVERMIQQVVDKWGQIDVLVNNAGIVGVIGNVWELPIDVLDKLYHTNLRGVFLCCQKVVPHMLRKDYGRIVNIASVSGKEGNPKHAPYSVTKAAVICLTKSLGKELATTKITVNAISPALVYTDLLGQWSPEDISYLVSKIPMGRTGTIEEIADMTAWVASRECSFTTAAIFDISGGRATY
jgi:3-oxoacyl-[acyl-carrier protein] reductase